MSTMLSMHPAFIFIHGECEHELLTDNEHTTMIHCTITIIATLIMLFSISTIFFALAANDPPHIKVYKRNPPLSLVNISFTTGYLMVFMMYLLITVISDSISLFSAWIFNVLLDILLVSALLSFIIKWVYIERDIRFYQLIASSLYYDLSLFRSKNTNHHTTLRSKCKLIALLSVIVLSLVSIIQCFDISTYDPFGTISRIILLSFHALIILAIDIKMSCFCCSSSMTTFHTDDKDPFYIKLELRLYVLFQTHQVLWYIGAAIYRNDNNRWYNHMLTRFIFEGGLLAIHCFLSGCVPLMSILNDNQSKKYNSDMNDDNTTNQTPTRNVVVTPSTFDDRFFPHHSETNLSLTYHLSSPSARSQRKFMRMDQAFEKSLICSDSKQLNVRAIMVNRKLRRQYLNYLMRSFMIESAWFIIETSMFKAAIQNTILAQNMNPILSQNMNPKKPKKVSLISYLNTSQFDELDLFYVGPEPHVYKLVSIFSTIDLMKKDAKHFDDETHIKWFENQQEARQLEVGRIYRLQSLKLHSMRIYQFYLSSRAEQSVNLSSGIRSKLATFFENGVGDFGDTTVYELSTIFDDAFFEIHNLLQSNISGFIQQLRENKK